MTEALIIDAVRTPIGRRGGRLRDWHPVDLAATTLHALVERNGIDPGTVDDVIMGCAMQVGEQAANVGRNAVLAAGWPDTVPGITVDRQCGSSLQAAHFAAQGVIAGAYDLVVAAGVEAMTRVPMGASFMDGTFGFPFGPQVGARFAPSGGLVPQGVSAELIADEWQISRAEMDAFALSSQQAAARATREARFEHEIIPILDAVGQTMTRDEGIRPTTAEALAGLRPAFQSGDDGGRITAGNASQISDGAAAVLIASRERTAALGLRPMARFVAFAVAGDDPRLMFTAAIPATRQVLTRAGLTIADIDRIEVNEAFASAVLAWQREIGADMERVNVNGGAIALGHPLGATGARMLTTLVHELRRSGGRYGLQVMCEAGGLANAVIVERIEG